MRSTPTVAYARGYDLKFISNYYKLPLPMQILREVGLKHEVDDAETFIACARRVAANWAEAPGSHQPAAAASAAMKVPLVSPAHCARFSTLLLTFCMGCTSQLGGGAFAWQPAGHSGCFCDREGATAALMVLELLAVLLICCMADIG